MLGLLVAIGAPIATAQERSVERRPRIKDHDLGGPGSGGNGGSVEHPVSSAYRLALTQLAGGSSGDALSAIAALEAEYSTPEERDQPLEGELYVLADLARRNPESLVPALVMHIELYHRYRQEQRFAQAVLNATMAERIAEIYADLGGGGAEVVVGRALASLGLELLEERRLTQARRVLARSLEHDPSNPAALLGLGADRERSADYSAAVDYFSRLVEAQPDSAEARLRLALNLRRTGRGRSAEAALTELVAGEKDGWPVVIAYQELARGLLDQGREQQAATLLRQAIERFPDEDRLRLQLAWALDLGGRPGEAKSIVERLAARPPTFGDSPRRRYNRSPETLPARNRELLEEAAEERLAALEQAIQDSLNAPVEGL